eukprot:GILJ01014020.1.p2 GENE.GILJ01014020.1~~GILJ01014020.1.p2  ORF type:complete len:386 (-),score=57.04 GILJ01014020.1:25-1182(-)
MVMATPPCIGLSRTTCQKPYEYCWVLMRRVLFETTQAGGIDGSLCSNRATNKEFSLCELQFPSIFTEYMLKEKHTDGQHVERVEQFLLALEKLSAEINADGNDFYWALLDDGSFFDVFEHDRFCDICIRRILEITKWNLEETSQSAMKSIWSHHEACRANADCHQRFAKTLGLLECSGDSMPSDLEITCDYCKQVMMKEATTLQEQANAKGSKRKNDSSNELHINKKIKIDESEDGSQDDDDNQEEVDSEDNEEVDSGSDAEEEVAETPSRNQPQTLTMRTDVQTKDAADPASLENRSAMCIIVFFKDASIKVRRMDVVMKTAIIGQRGANQRVPDAEREKKRALSRILVLTACVVPTAKKSIQIENEESNNKHFFIRQSNLSCL